MASYKRDKHGNLCELRTLICEYTDEDGKVRRTERDVMVRYQGYDMVIATIDERFSS